MMDVGYTTIRKTAEEDNSTASLRELSGRVLDSRPKGRGLESDLRHCVVVLEQDLFILA